MQQPTVDMNYVAIMAVESGPDADAYVEFLGGGIQILSFLAADVVPKIETREQADDLRHKLSLALGCSIGRMEIPCGKFQVIVSSTEHARRIREALDVAFPVLN